MPSIHLRLTKKNQPLLSLHKIQIKLQIYKMILALINLMRAVTQPIYQELHLSKFAVSKISQRPSSSQPHRAPVIYLPSADYHQLVVAVSLLAVLVASMAALAALISTLPNLRLQIESSPN